MTHYHHLFLLLCAFAKADDNLRIIYTANRQGEIEPCDCQTNQVGGLNRLGAFFDRIQKEAIKPPVFFSDSGDTFFSAGTLPEIRKPQERLRAELIARAYQKLRLDAFTPGERDFALGVDFLRQLEKQSGAVFISSNLTDLEGKSFFERFRVFQKGKAKIAVIALADEKAFEKIAGVKAISVDTALEKVLSDVKAVSPSLIILLSHLGLPRDRELAKKGVVDVILGSHSLDVLSQPERVGKTIILQPQFQGQQIGVLDFALNDLTKITHRLVDLTKDLDEKNSLKVMMTEYRQKVRNLALQPTGPKKKEVASYVAHPFICRTCHQKQYDWWANTKHASAYLVLFSKNQHFDPECVGCHTLGFQSKGGFQQISEPLVVGPSVKKKGEVFVESFMKGVFGEELKKGPLDSRVSPKRGAKLHQRYTEEIHKLESKAKILKNYLGVQCEHCHGNRNGHPNPSVVTLKNVAETSCRKCHAPPNAPDFDPTSIKRIGCPLMQKP